MKKIILMIGFIGTLVSFDATAMLVQIIKKPTYGLPHRLCSFSSLDQQIQCNKDLLALKREELKAIQNENCILIDQREDYFKGLL